MGIYEITAALASVFGVLCFPLAADISLLALPLALGFSAVVWLLARKCNASGRASGQSTLRGLSAAQVARPQRCTLRKLFQYLPYVLLAAFILRRAGAKGTSYPYDCVTVVLWCAVFVLSCVSSHSLSSARGTEDGKDNNGTASGKKDVCKKGVLWAGKQAVDWADALLQAVFMVLLIQIFIVQLYVIPSESMVPQFLIKDRVVVFKTASGPKFPLSDVGIPRIKQYKRGDIVVFRNPHYSMDRKSEVRTVTSQLVYMLTFMAVNLNRDENGEPKADPLVKRVAGVEGEQLVMQDGVLYRRTKDSAQWQAVEEDAAKAAWNLNALDEKTKKGVAAIVLPQEQYDTMINVEEKRRALNIEDTARECQGLSGKFSAICRAKGGAQSIAFQGQAAEQGALEMTAAEMNEYVLFARYDSLTQRLLTVAGGEEWFKAFMTDWIGTRPAEDADVYTLAMWRLNLMIKRCIGAIVVRNAALIMAESPARAQTDALLTALFFEADALHLYVQLLDQRNMCVFPPNAPDGSAQYIPKDCYFMMGDNRFNSMDMRHSYTERLVPLTALDKYSVTYRSNLSPQYVNASHILGTTAFRFWPIGRIGRL